MDRFRPRLVDMARSIAHSRPALVYLAALALAMVLTYAAPEPYGIDYEPAIWQHPGVLGHEVGALLCLPWSLLTACLEFLPPMSDGGLLTFEESSGVAPMIVERGVPLLGGFVNAYTVSRWRTLRPHAVRPGSGSLGRTGKAVVATHLLAVTTAAAFIPLSVMFTPVEAEGDANFAGIWLALLGNPWSSLIARTDEATDLPVMPWIALGLLTVSALLNVVVTYAVALAMSA
jgi:hypothetical protein